MDQKEHKLVIICFLFIIGNTYSCNITNKPWCDTIQKNDVCPVGKDVINYTAYSGCPATCGCYGDTRCCDDGGNICTPVMPARSGTCCFAANGWCQDGRDGEGNMHAVCCTGNTTCVRRDINGSLSPHGFATCEPF